MQHISTQAETWKPVVGWEGSYEVSDHGRVRSMDRVITKVTLDSQTIRGTILKPYAQSSGHLNVYFWKNNQKVNRLVHRVVLEAFVGACPEGMECCHWDDDPANNHIDNLRWDTAVENKRDMIRNGNHHESNQTHCIRGHELVQPNLIPSGLKRGHRGCLSCSRARNYVYYREALKGQIKSISDDYYRKIMSHTS